MVQSFRNLNSPKLWDKLLIKKNKALIKSPIYKHKIDEVLLSISNNKGKFLDIGFGSGNLEKQIIKSHLDIDIYGVDISPKAVKMARRKIKGNFYIANIFKLPFHKDFFNVVTILDVLEHIEENRALNALREVKRVLKKNGKLIISVPLNENLSQLIEQKKNYNAHMREYTYEIIKKELRKMGFRIVSKKFLFAFKTYYKLKTFIMNFMPGLKKQNLLIIECIKK